MYNKKDLFTIELFDSDCRLEFCKEKIKMKRTETIVATVFFFISLMLVLLYAYIAMERALTGIDVIVIQILALFTGLAGSYILGRRSLRDSISEMIEPHARSAFRRLISLYRSISRVVTIIDSEELKDDASKLNVIRAIVVEQITTADDALADWQDIVPKSC